VSSDAQFADLYPEVAAVGSLAAALEAAAARGGRSLGAVPPAPPDTPLHSATVPSLTGWRDNLSVSAIGAQRCYRIGGWGLGMCLIVGDTDDLGEVVEAAYGWRTGVPLHDLRRSVPFVRLTHRGEVVEQGPAAVVTAEWRMVRQRAEEGDHPRHRELVETAYREPKLRQLYPYTTHQVLSFSTTTGYPFSPSPVSLTAWGPSTSFYRVWVAGGVAVGDVSTAEDAVALAVMHLPADIGPASAGSYADDGPTP
jgi:hypothetical protein